MDWLDWAAILLGYFFACFGIVAFIFVVWAACQPGGNDD